MIFTDPQGKKALRSVQILKESSTWESLTGGPRLSRASSSFLSFMREHCDRVIKYSQYIANIDIAANNTNHLKKTSGPHLKVYAKQD